MQAVDYLHSNKIVHGDIKLSNIMIDLNGKIKLIDFGFSTFPYTKDNLIKKFCGTPAYMSPELLNEIPYNGESNEDLRRTSGPWGYYTTG